MLTPKCFWQNDQWTYYKADTLLKIMKYSFLKKNIFSYKKASYNPI